jgi:hypothetical protein
MKNHTNYEERVSSRRTEALFIALTGVFLLLLIWSVNGGEVEIVSVGLVCLYGFFLFCSLNYRTLVIRITPEALVLRFGILRWTVPLENVEDCRLDDVPLLMRWGGAGVHFMFVRKRYRVSFNFLEYPRVVVALKRKRGLVRDVSFSTQWPNDVLRHIRESAAREGASSLLGREAAQSV